VKKIIALVCVQGSLCQSNKTRGSKWLSLPVRVEKAQFNSVCVYIMII
jgi:hypothetical protein